MPEALKIGDLSPAEKREAQGVTKTVRGIAAQYAVVKEKARDIAPRVMRLFARLQAEHENLGGFIGFCRLLDPSIPLKAGSADEPGYRAHKTYYTLDYIRREYTRQQREGLPRNQGKRDPARDQLARLIKTVLQAVRDSGPVWTALAREFGMAPRMIKRLQSRVEDAEPLINLTGAIGRPVAIDDTRIVHVEPLRGAAAAAPGGVVEKAVRKAVKRAA